MKLYLGCGPLPIHPQHLEVMHDLTEWTLVDKYVEDPEIKPWDATNLWQVEDESVEHIYASHLLEHLPHTKVKEVLKDWFYKLQKGGKLTLNVPDMLWTAKQIVKYASNGFLDGYYNQWDGEHGLMSIVYGSQSHEGELHKSGFYAEGLFFLLIECGFSDIEVKKLVDSHEMGVLIAICHR